MNFFLIKHILFFLNGIYMVLSLILIGLAAYARLSVYITSVSIVGGIIACGVFLFLLSLLGFIGTARHSQAALFFYIVLLFSLFLIQFSVACACLTLSTSDQRTIVEAAWQKSTNATKIDMMRTFQCCGFRRVDLPHDHPMGCPPCHFSELSCCEGDHDRQADCCTVEQKLERGIRVTGTVGLFFSLVELAGVWLALQYRHKRDPSIDPNCIF
ncbi:hypothetical protein T265_09351 [Opisthorchis viverrini]|uniref:Tetraspanin family protein n=1 Tax=Opisthorchis viverrini TaxID=6198 RepID=A0A074ZH91_OPIVI|nr:hypothetical protein T265_09351 [Opisthorchis viverrini]KER22590.1 hypothetical protein T265_09351 [Opisthorchis viverrini]